MGNKRWSEAEEYALIEYLASNFDQYAKGVKVRYYASASVLLATKMPTQIKSKSIELEASYKQFKTKLARSGFGLETATHLALKVCVSLSLTIIFTCMCFSITLMRLIHVFLS